MQKAKLNITLDSDLIDFIKLYAKQQRTSVSDIITQFILNVKRSANDDPMDVIISDPDFYKSLLDSITKIRAGKMKWHSYNEVFE